MNCSVQPDFDAIVTELLASGLLNSLCTITVPPEVYGLSGAPDPDVAYLDLAGHVAIPCTAPPLMTADKVATNEIKLSNETKSETYLHVLLGGYYPAIIQNYRAEIDDTEWDIVSVEHDSQHRTTRLAVRQVTI